MSRKPHTTKDLQRRRPKRAPYDRVLIVSEGEKTEPHYFSALVADLRLNTTNVEVDGESDSSPRSVVAHAKKRYREDLSIQGNESGFDRVYCVIDKDEHLTYQEALSSIKQATPKGVFYAIPSVPCFEFWLLLHFRYTTQPISRSGDRSPGDNTQLAVKEFLPSYKKEEKDTYDKIKDKTQKAIENAEKVNRANEQVQTDNPSTQVHKLVLYLQELAQ